MNCPDTGGTEPPLIQWWSSVNFEAMFWVWVFISDLKYMAMFLRQKDGLSGAHAMLQGLADPTANLYP